MKQDLKILEKKSSLINVEVSQIIDPSKTEKCNCCNKMYRKKDAAYCFTNYGGQVRKLSYCSENCRNQVVEINPGRISITKPKPMFLW